MLKQRIERNNESSPKESSKSFFAGSYTFGDQQSGLLFGIRDLIAGILHTRLWLMLAANEMQTRYHRTIFGPIWVLVSFSVFLLVKIFIFTGMSGTDEDYYIAYLTMGLCVWYFITGAVGDGAAIFVRNSTWILGIRTPYSLFIYSHVAFSLLNFVICLVPSYIIVFLYQSIDIGDILLSLFGSLLVAYCLTWIVLFLALLSVFMRDTIQLVITIMRVMFFLTPILWLPSTIGAENAVFVFFNPIYHMIELVRAPLLSGSIPMINLIVVLSITIVMQTTAIVAFGLLRRWIPSYL